METFLVYWFMVSVVALCWAGKKWYFWRNSFVLAVADRDRMDRLMGQSALQSASWQTKYENLVIEIQKKVLTGSQSKPQNQVRKAKSWAEIRKANEAAISEAETLEARREADTAYQE